ncbi:hypothetical protein DSO57_1012220 [Entomophthora muscae]|uniref:Uncharacterized protein n=1 Tax=Entomophthora muscae TaxID=34485 RepID=A0ACC2URY8_9FUNG|nr:hypothetical protein DSO57_1012220 [Entomophthora muscae]
MQSLMDALIQGYKSIDDNQQDSNYTLFNTARSSEHLWFTFRSYQEASSTQLGLLLKREEIVRITDVLSYFVHPAIKHVQRLVAHQNLNLEGNCDEVNSLVSTLC